MAGPGSGVAGYGPGDLRYWFGQQGLAHGLGVGVIGIFTGPQLAQTIGAPIGAGQDAAIDAHEGGRGPGARGADDEQTAALRRQLDKQVARMGTSQTASPTVNPAHGAQGQAPGREQT